MHTPSRRALQIRCLKIGEYCLCILMIAGPLRADENPFGLPAPEHNRSGAVMLHGGGAGLADDVRREFVRLAGAKEARIVLLPSDMCQRGKDDDGQPLPGGETREAYLRRISAPRNYGRWIGLRDGHVAGFEFLIRDSEADPGDAKFFAALESATGVWLPAYDQTWLPEQFAADYPQKMSRFQQALRNVVARGGVVGGLGGGMACLPETIIAGDDNSDEGGWVRAKLRFGLGLLEGVVVDQNFDAWTGRLERVTDLLRNGPRLDRLGRVPGVQRRTIGIGVERQTVVILCGNTFRVLGEGRGHLFLKSNGDRTITWKTLAAGDEPLTIMSTSLRRRGEPDARSKPADNPFGMPGGTVVLHGGGNTDEIVQMYPGLFPRGERRLVHCPAARESCRPSAQFAGAALEARLNEVFSNWRALQTTGQVRAFSFLTTSTPADANREEFLRPLTNANGLWFCGGDQRPLAELFVDAQRPTRFQQEVQRILRNGGVVGGSSAGLAIMPDVMIEGGAPERGKPATAELSRGLGVLQHVLAEQHFDARAGRIERLTGLLRDHKRLANFAPTCQPQRMIGLAVDEQTALLVQGAKLQVTGKRLAHVFLQTTDRREITWHALHPGDVATLTSGPAGYVLTLEDWELGR